MNWQIKQSYNYKEYMQNYSIHSLLAKVLDSKNLDAEDVEKLLNPKLRYHDFSLFLDADIALDRIYEALDNDEKICIYGDYDCDGILSTAILVQAFLSLGKKVGYHIPHRMEDGYGLNSERVRQMHEKGYSLIITVDNGIKAYEAIELADSLGIDVIVIDHHEYAELPNACAIIHTKLSPDYPFKEICGGFLAYKLASALLKKHDKYLFSLAAITTVSDMMPLVDENRSLVQRALKFMAEEKFMQIDLLLGENQAYNVNNIGFIIAPKINSFGRLPEMINPNHLVRYFLKDVDQAFALKIANAAKTINTKRQELTTRQYNQILKKQTDDDFLFVYDEDIHEGIVGLIAGKYTRQFQRPSFVMTYDQRNDCYKGSARSTETIPLNKIFESLKEDMLQYGGHALAGGFTVAKDQVEKMKADIKEYLAHVELEEPAIDTLLLSEDDISLYNIKELEKLEPFGQGNEEMLFLLKDLHVQQSKVLSGGKHIRYDVSLPYGQLQALLFNCQNALELKNRKNISVVGKLKINKYLNNESINMIIEDMK